MKKIKNKIISVSLLLFCTYIGLTILYVTFVNFTSFDSCGYHPISLVRAISKHWSPIWLLFSCRSEPAFSSSILCFCLSDRDVYYNFGLLNLFLLTTIYYKTTHLLTRGNISPLTSLGDFIRMSHCLKLDPLCLISLLRFYGFGALFPTKYIAAILIGIEL